jgi:putative sterol carrier protein
VVDEGRLQVHPGEAEAADVTLVQTREVAAALSRGELNAQQALEAGRLKLRGDIGHLAREGRALSAMEDVFAAVRAVTSY